MSHRKQAASTGPSVVSSPRPGNNENHWSSSLRTSDQMERAFWTFPKVYLIALLKQAYLCEHMSLLSGMQKGKEKLLTLICILSRLSIHTSISHKQWTKRRDYGDTHDWIRTRVPAEAHLYFQDYNPSDVCWCRRRSSLSITIHGHGKQNESRRRRTIEFHWR